MKRWSLLLLLLPAVAAGCICVEPAPATRESPLETVESPIETPAYPIPTEGAIPTQDPKEGSIEGIITMQGHPPGVFPATLDLRDPTG